MLDNLVDNAIVHGQRGVTVELEVVEHGGAAVIGVRDNGPGISAELRTRIFTPYFTTKQDGSGLGLVIAQRIIFDHNGEIDVNSSDERGTEFVIRLPLVS